MVKLERIIRGCTIGTLGAAVYILSLAAGYTVANHHKVKALEYGYEVVKRYGNIDEKHGRYAELYRMHKQKGEKWEKATKSVDLFHKLGLYR